MTHHRPPIPVTLTLPAEPPTPAEVDAILMAADAVAGSVGRTGLVQILHGSRSQKMSNLDWDQLPDYGALRPQTTKVIGTKVDWCIHHDWLRIEYDRDIPLLFLSARGWQRVKSLWIRRLLGWFDSWIASGHPEQVWPTMDTVRREIKFVLLTTIEQDRRLDLAPVLRAWKPHEVKKVRQAIQHTLNALQSSPP